MADICQFASLPCPLLIRRWAGGRKYRRPGPMERWVGGAGSARRRWWLSPPRNGLLQRGGIMTEKRLEGTLGLWSRRSDIS